MSAATSAAAQPKANTGQPTVTASARGTACPPMALNNATMPAATPRPPRRSPLTTPPFGEALAKQPAPRRSKRRTRRVYPRCRCRPRATYRPATLTHATREHERHRSQTTEEQASSLLFNSSSIGRTVAVSPYRLGLAWAGRLQSRRAPPEPVADGRSIAKPADGVPPSRAFGCVSSGAAGSQKSTRALTS